MNIKKIISVILSAMIMIITVCGCFSVTAGAEGTVTYSYVVSTYDSVNGFEGELYYPKALSVKQITFSGMKNDKTRKIIFNDSNVIAPFDFSDGKNLITVEFNINGEYNADDIYVKMSEFYSYLTVTQGNIPFDYANVVDGEIVSRGHTDIDTPSNSYVETKYSVTYRYKENPQAETLCTTTAKPIWTVLNSAKSIAEISIPRIDNPYYSYSVDSAEFTGTGSKSITALLKNTTKTYNVSLDGQLQGNFAYLDPATVSADAEKDFFINGIYVSTGKSLTLFVTDDMDILTEEPAGEVSDSATLINNALYVNDNLNNEGRAVVNMEMLVSATSTNFSRMGVAFSESPCVEDDIRNAVNAVTTGTAKINKIAVHNSKVDYPNISGQYQFIYAPYVSVSKVSKDKILYFYSYVVNKDGTITVSDAAQVRFSNVLD